MSRSSPGTCPVASPAAPRCRRRGADRTTAVPPLRSIRPRTDWRSPSRSSGTSSGSKPGPRSRTNAVTWSGSTSAYSDTGAPPAYFAALTSASRAASRSAARCSSIGQSPTTTTSIAMPCASSTSAAAALERGGQVLVRVGAPPVEPAAQLALLRPGQPGHLARVVDVALDEGQRVQHRVVHVRRDLGALLLADPRVALRRQLARHLQPPRAAHQGQPGDHDEGGHQAAGGAAHLRRADEDRSGPDDHQRGTDPDPGRTGQPVRPRRDPPALPGVVVGLAPQDGDADARRRRAGRPGRVRTRGRARAAAAARRWSASPAPAASSGRARGRAAGRPRTGSAARRPRTGRTSRPRAPPAAASRMNASRTSSTSTPRWSASPRATPASTRPSLLRYIRGAATGPAGAPAGVPPVEVMT